MSRIVLPPNWNWHMKEALKLVRDLRAKALSKGINAMALHIALKFAMLADEHCARESGLTDEELKSLDAVAEQLYRECKDLSFFGC